VERSLVVARVLDLIASSIYIYPPGVISGLIPETQLVHSSHSRSCIWMEGNSYIVIYVRVVLSIQLCLRSLLCLPEVELVWRDNIVMGRRVWP
jgi:hypothetical protein